MAKNGKTRTACSMRIIGAILISETEFAIQFIATFTLVITILLYSFSTIQSIEYKRRYAIYEVSFIQHYAI